MTKRIFNLLALVLVAHGARNAAAQQATVPPTAAIQPVTPDSGATPAAPRARSGDIFAQRRFTALVGLNVAKLTTDGDDSDHLFGLVAGVGLVQPIARNWDVQPEVTYSMKGGKFSDADFTVRIRPGYLEIPILARYNVPGSGLNRPHFLVGPAFAFKTNCSVHVHGDDFVDDDLPPGVDSIVVTTDTPSCGDIFNTFDVGVVLGAGIAIRASHQVLSLDARYNFGLADATDNPSTKNRVLSFVASLEWPWRF